MMLRIFLVGWPFFLREAVPPALAGERRDKGSVFL